MSQNDPEVEAIPILLATLEPLPAEQRVRVLNFVLDKLNIRLQTGGTSDQPSSSASDLAVALGTQVDVSSPAKTHSADMRSLKHEKKPRTASEMVALIAYYLEHLAPQAERRDFITAEDVRPYFKQAQFELPSAPPGVTLGHAKNAGYLTAGARGQYRLNPVGYNLVAHKLPADGIESRPAKKSRKTTAKKKMAKEKADKGK
jgi:hypothetical protein